MCAARPDTCEAVWESLNKLAASAQEVVHVFDVDPESQASWWARAFAAQCRAALDDLTFLAPWTALPFSVEALGDFPYLAEIPTLRTLANLDKELLPDTDCCETDASTYRRSQGAPASRAGGSIALLLEGATQAPLMAGKHPGQGEN